MNLKDKKTGKWGIGRAIGNKQYPGTGEDFYYQVFADFIPANEWETITFTGGYHTTTLYINGNKIAAARQKQFVCPLKTIGSNSGHLSANVLLDDIKVFSRILDEGEIKTAGLKTGLTISASDDPVTSVRLPKNGMKETR